ncbi:MAG TPA: hypothetical protein PK076_12590 [Saprospiraceae bacterium]|nr:hypothetical protein [Saprospiraceae bacterium]HQW56963.1 hypothetical protein [Saprospiraceae bacterium]
MAQSGIFTRPYNYRRFIYLGIGILMLVLSIIDHIWPGIFISAYFIAMGFFGFGCAGKKDCCN